VLKLPNFSVIKVDRSIQENYYLRLPSGPPTQADIWEGLPAWAEAEETCTGILITPRCDFAHDKTPVINYLPIISLNKYLLQFGGFGLVEQEIGRIRTNLRNTARSLGILEHLDLGLPPEMLSDLMDQGRLDISQTNATQQEKHLSDFQASSQRLAAASKLLESNVLSESDITAFTNKRELERLTRDVVRNAINDTFFLPPCTAILESPSVVLLRHIYTCRIEIFTTGLNGPVDQRSTPPRRPERMIRLKSPYIEALVSRLATLFTRVGIRDLPSGMVDAFAKIG
jgi:hypothetical protein